MTREADGIVHIVEADQPEHRDDALVLDIIKKAIVEFHNQCVFATGVTLARMPPPPPPITTEHATATITLGIIQECPDAEASLIIKRLEEAGFAVGMFR